MRYQVLGRLYQLNRSLMLGLALVFIILASAGHLKPVAAQPLSATLTDPGSAPKAIAVPDPSSVQRVVMQPPAAPLLIPSQSFSLTQVTDTGANFINEHPSVNGAGDHIAFVSNFNIVGPDTGQKEIFLYDETTPFIRITDNANEVNVGPSINQNGEQIAFYSTGDWSTDNNDDNLEIFKTLTTAPLTFRQATSTTATIAPGFFPFNGFPSISNDGNRIAFVSTHNINSLNPDNNAEIFLYIDIVPNGQIRRVTNSTGGGISSQTPMISGDGNTIVFASNADLLPPNNADNNFEIFLATDTGASFTISQITQTPTGVTNHSPSISTDGTQVVFASNGNQTGANADGNQEVFLYNTTTGLTQVTSSTATIINEQPSISGDGLRLSFVSTGNLDQDNTNTDNNREIFVAAIDLPSIIIQQVTSSTVGITNTQPSINDFGNKIAFASNGNEVGTNADGNQEIFVAEQQLVDLTLSKSASPVPAKLGQALTYTIIVTNNGPSNASNITVIDSLPSNVELASTDPGSPTCQSSNQLVTCTLPTLNNNQSEIISIVVTPTSLVTLTNGASVTGTIEDRDRTNNVLLPTLTTEVRSVAALTVTKTVTPTKAKKGDTLVYTIVVSNSGPFTATDLTVVDLLPPQAIPQINTVDFEGNSFGSGTPNGIVQNGSVLALNSGNNSGTYRRIINSETPINWNELTWLTTRPVNKELPDNGRDDVGYAEGLSMFKNELLFHFNNVLNFTYYDLWPNTSGQSFLGYCYTFFSDCPNLDNNGKFNKAAAFDGDEYIFTNLNIDQQNNSSNFTIMAWIKPTGFNVGTQHIISTDRDVGAFDWALVRQGNNWNVFTGANNQSAGAAVDLNQWQHIAVVFQQSGINFYKNGTFISNLPITYDGDSSNYVSIGSPSFTFSSQGFVGTIDEVSIFTRPLNNNEILNHYLRGALQLDIRVRSCDQQNCSDNPAFSAPFSELNNKTVAPPKFSLSVPTRRYFEYEVTMARDSGLTHSPELVNVSITHDNIDALEVSPFSCQKGINVTCDLTDLAPNSPTTVMITTTANTAKEFENTVVVTSSAYLVGTDDYPIVVSDTVSTILEPVDLSITKIGPGGTVLTGDTIPFTITVTNNSTDTTALDVVLTDTVPTGFNVIQLPENCENLGNIVCNWAEIEAGISETIVIGFVANEAGGYTNNVEVIAVNDNTGDTDTAGQFVTAATDLSVTKSYSPQSVSPGEPLTYTIRVINNGPVDATGITLSDTLKSDEPVTITTIIQPGTGNCAPSIGTNINCNFNLGSLNPNNSTTVTVVIIPSVEGLITNTARAESVEIERLDFDNIAVVTINSGGSGIYLPIIMKN